MAKQKAKANYRRTVLGLPDLDHSKVAVLNSLTSPFKQALDQWTSAAGIVDGRVFRGVGQTGRVWGQGISQNVVWYVVQSCGRRAGLEDIAPHYLRRTCAKLCHSNGGELEQIQFLLGHASVQTTERYLGCKQNLGHPVNDRFTLGRILEEAA